MLPDVDCPQAWTPGDSAAIWSTMHAGKTEASENLRFIDIEIHFIGAFTKVPKPR